MALLTEHLFESGDDLAEITISLAQNTRDGEVAVTFVTRGHNGSRRSKVVRLRSGDVAGLENVPEVLRIVGQMWLWDDDNILATAVRLVKKGRRPAPQ